MIDDVVDAHVHVAPRDSPPGTVASPFGPVPAVVADAEDLLRVAEPCGVGQAVLVQPGSLGLDHSYLLTCLRDQPTRFVGTVLADPRDVDRFCRLVDSAAADRVTSLRVAPLLTTDDDWFGPSAEALSAAAVDHELVVSVLAGPASAAALVRWAERWPTTTVVLDHLGRPDLAPDLTTAREALRRVAELPTAFVKVSALDHLASGMGADALRSVVDYALEVFGVERCMWGSDHPFVGARGYAGDVALTEQLLGRLAEPDLAQLMHRTARRVFGLPPPERSTP